MHPLLALRAFFKILFSDASAAQAKPWLTGQAALTPPPAAPPAPVPAPPVAPPAPPPPSRSDALTLLATLQREARFIDFLKEPLGEFTDAQIGAAARDVHRDCAAVVDRLFGIQPVRKEAEGSTLSVPADAERYRLTGRVTGDPPFRGKLVHPGWEAARCDVPTWQGSPAAARVIAPAEIEM